ncbi:MAG: histidinol-phosphatase HisJ family protein [Oscillospiraceae bacterium]|nr:histidinol-phosphatase HisJ family protein [Oscillospiraceae bacterium]
MLKADYHVHSSCSSDAENTMLEMALSAKKAGLNLVCFTDHCDTERFDTGEYDPDCYNRAEMLRQFAEASGCGIELRLGVEIGEALHQGKTADSVAADEALDFVISSVHAIRGEIDFYCLDYSSRERCENLLKRYVEEHEQLVEQTDSFDVIGHIGYPLRYMYKNGFADLSLLPYEERLAGVFRRIAYKGKGIEINSSGLRKEGRQAMPSLPLLKLYKECGGEIITVGSDAHRVSDIGSGVNECFELLREAGFKYYTVFRARKPEFIKL